MRQAVTLIGSGIEFIQMGIDVEGLNPDQYYVVYYTKSNPDDIFVSDPCPTLEAAEHLFSALFQGRRQ